MKKQLSIFVDESGNVGFNSEGASNFYIVCMVFHDQKDDISEQLEKIKNEPVFHVGPLIGGTDEFSNIEPRERQKLLNKILIFTSIVPIKQKTFVYDKKDFHCDRLKLMQKMSKDLNAFLLSNQSYFLSFDEIVVYYDGGQQIVSNALAFAFGGVGYNVSFKERVVPALSLIDDLICRARMQIALIDPSQNLLIGIQNSKMGMFCFVLMQ